MSQSVKPLPPLQLGRLESLATVKERAQYIDLTFLETLTIEEAWNAFLEELFKQDRMVDSRDIPWLESRIPQLLTFKDQAGRMPYEGFGSQLADWYLFHSGHSQDRSVAAIAFAISLYRDQLITNRDFEKKIFRRLADSGQYWRVAIVDPFIRSCFVEIRANEFKNKDTYMDTAWFSAARAINCIMEARDISMLPLLTEILAEHEAGIVALWEYIPGAQRFERAKNLAILREAVAMLEQMRKEQQPSLTKVVGEPLAKAAQLEGGVLIKLDCPKKIPAEEREKGVHIFVSSACEHSKDAMRLSKFLEDD